MLNILFTTFFRWAANDSFLMIYMALLAAELRYLNISLNIILNRIRTNEKGITYMDETKVEGKTINQLRNFNNLKESIKIFNVSDLNDSFYEEKRDIKLQLDIWIFHHAELTRYTIHFRGIYKYTELIHIMV